MNIDILQDGTGFTEVDPGAKHLLSIRCEDGKVGKQKPSASRELVQPVRRWDTSVPRQVNMTVVPRVVLLSQLPEEGKGQGLLETGFRVHLAVLHCRHLT